MDKQINEIQRVINTLQTIKVEGEYNLDALLASIRHLRLVKNELTQLNAPVDVKDVQVEVTPDENDKAE